MPSLLVTARSLIPTLLRVTECAVLILHHAYARVRVHTHSPSLSLSLSPLSPVARLKAHEEAERVRKLAEDSERQGIQDAIGKEREKERELQKRNMEAERALAAQRQQEAVLLREKQDVENRQARRKQRNQENKLWGGWRRELGVRDVDEGEDAHSFLVLAQACDLYAVRST